MRRRFMEASRAAEVIALVAAAEDERELSRSLLEELCEADHARSMAELAVEVSGRIGLGPGELDDLRYGATFHDIGKIAIPDAILNKPGALVPAERELLERHTEFGEQILAPVPFLSRVRRMVRHAHERWDGKGYPDGLSREAIPLDRGSCSWSTPTTR